MKTIMRYVWLMIVSAAVSVGTTYYVMNTKLSGREMTMTENGDSLSLTTSPYTRLASLTDAGETNFTQAAEMSVNAVVHVKVTYPNQRQTYSTDPFFEFFFGRPQQRETPAQRASGSGVIIAKDGYIVTNNHVIDKAAQIVVVLNDKREFNATLVGTDPNTDIALLKIEADNLPVILMGNSDELRIGEWVLAVGNPFNLTSTVTAGIVSAKARNINILNTEMKIESFIQTDAAVNPGNSGGALVNTKGELVGINTAIASQTGSYSGYSFAVPTSIVQKVVSDLRQYGIVQRAILGIQMQEITAELKNEKHLSTLQGAYVTTVIPDGAAYKAGVKAGDVITQIDAAAIHTNTDLQEQIARHRPGDSVTLTVLRGDKMLTLVAELTNRQGGTGLIEKQNNVSLGAEIEELPDNIKQRLGINYGVQVTNLKNGALKKAGVPNGYIILKANNRTIRTTTDWQDVVQQAMAASDNDQVLFLTGCTQQGRILYYAVNLRE